MAVGSSVPYWQRLDLDGPPPVVDLCRGNAKLFHLLVAVLLEYGRPMSDEEVAARLESAGARARTGDMVLSLRRAWHGQPPVLRDPDGRLALDLGSSRLRYLMLELGLRRPPAARKEPSPPCLPPPPPDHVPLSEEEVDTAFRGRRLGSLSALRQAAAVLDARGVPMSPTEVEAVLAALTPHRSRIHTRTSRAWRGELVTLDSDGRLVLDPTSPRLAATRRAVRALVRAAREERERAAHLSERIAWYDARQRAEEHRQAQLAATLRRAVIRLLPDGDAPVAATVLDVEARSLRTLVGGDLEELPELLAGFNLLAGLSLRAALVTLGLDPDRWRLVELAPPRKTRKLDRSGRTLMITSELLITATTGISRPLADPAKVAEYLRSGNTTRLTRRLESDAKALFAFYRYGVLHRAVRLRWGFIDDEMRVDWAQPGDHSLYDILRRCKEMGQQAEVVLGSAPGWGEPWSRARPAWVEEVGFGRAVLVMDGVRHPLSLAEIQDARPAPSPTGR